MTRFLYFLAGAVVFVVLLYCQFLFDHYSDIFLRKIAGKDDRSDWQPAVRPWVAIVIGGILIFPVVIFFSTGWARRGFCWVYFTYAAWCMFFALILAVSSGFFQRWAFVQQPVPSQLWRRFLAGLTFFLVMGVTGAVGWFRWAWVRGS